MKPLAFSRSLAVNLPVNGHARLAHAARETRTDRGSHEQSGLQDQHRISPDVVQSVSIGHQFRGFCGGAEREGGDDARARGATWRALRKPCGAAKRGAVGLLVGSGRRVQRLMSTSLVSGRNSSPTTKLMAATTTGYQRPE